MPTLPFVFFDRDDIAQVVRKRSNETKLGERVAFPGKIREEQLAKILQESPAPFVLLGIPEDVGVKANYGRGGAWSAWAPALFNLLNQQSNAYFEGPELMVLGYLNCDEIITKTEEVPHNKAQYILRQRELTSAIDERVTTLVKTVVASGKTLIVIGGGHNNSYGCIKGSALGLGVRNGIPEARINALNCDVHTDFRALEGRHSGNGFSYAYEENYLNKYAVLGMHEAYTSSAIIRRFHEERTRLFYNTYEEIFIREQMSWTEATDQCIGHVAGHDCGLELDLDSIQNIPSSAKTSSGISPLQARQFVHRAGKALKPVYFHIAEGAPVLSHIKTDNKTGKLIAYLVSDFIKSFATA